MLRNKSRMLCMVTHSKMSLGAESVRERRITRIVQHSTRRLKIKHEEIDAILSEVEELANKGKVGVAVSLLSAISPLILRSAVEEEARIMRAVMQRHKGTAQDSIAVTREHRAIAGFLEQQLPELGDKSPEEARLSIVGFVELLHGHLRREEKTSFSLAASEEHVI